MNEMRETTRVERRWDMESEKQSDSGVEHENDLCSMHKGLDQFFDFEEGLDPSV